MENEIKARLEKEHIRNVKILPLQPVSRVSYVYSLGDICVVSCKPGLGGSAMPSKTWSIMSCGRPVIANFDEGELKKIIEDNKCGVFTRAGDIIGFAETLKKLSKTPSDCVKMGENARQFILNNLTKEVGSKKYVEIIKSVVNN